LKSKSSFTFFLLPAWYLCDLYLFAFLQDALGIFHFFFTFLFKVYQGKTKFVDFRRANATLPIFRGFTSFDSKFREFLFSS